MAEWVINFGQYHVFSVGMYVSAAIQVSMFYDLGAFLAYGAVKPVLRIAILYWSGDLAFSPEVWLAQCYRYSWNARLDWGPYFAGGTRVAVAAREVRELSIIDFWCRYCNAIFTFTNREYRSAFFLRSLFIGSDGTFCHPMAVKTQILAYAIRR